MAYVPQSPLGCDGRHRLFTIEVWTPSGLVTYYVLFVIHLATRKISIVGATPNPNGAFMMQIARNLTDEFDGFLRNHRYLIMDRDTKFTEAFRDAEGGELVFEVARPQERISLLIPCYGIRHR